jgi:hypothetical protein
MGQERPIFDFRVMSNHLFIADARLAQSTVETGHKRSYSQPFAVETP